MNGNIPFSKIDPFVDPQQPGYEYLDDAQAAATLNYQINQLASAADVNFKARNNFAMKVQLSQTEAESKRLSLAFESRIVSEINWALNTLAIYSCNTSQNFTLENQPYLLESMSNYLISCLQNIESLSYTDPLQKRDRHAVTQVTGLVDAFQSG